MDGGRFHTVHSSTTKAVCAASNRRPTTTRGAQAQELDTLHALGLSLAAGPQRWTAMEGGFPILIDGHCVGGIGVSDEIAKTMNESGKPWMHAYTYSAHPTGCAIACAIGKPRSNAANT